MKTLETTNQLRAQFNKLKKTYEEIESRTYSEKNNKKMDEIWWAMELIIRQKNSVANHS